MRKALVGLLLLSCVSAQYSTSSAPTATTGNVTTTFTAAVTPTQSNPYISIFQSGVSFAPSPLPSAFPQASGEQIVAAFRNLGRTTVFQINQTQDWGTWVEAEGMVRIGPDRYFISNNYYTNATSSYGKSINGTDRTPGAGFGLLTVVDGNGTRVATVNLTEPGALEYHNGGIDYDGTYIWANIAQYRPNSTCSLVRIDPLTLDYTYIARFEDHCGGVVRDTVNNNTVNLNWGSRNATVWNLNETPSPYPAFTPYDAYLRNPSFWTDYQDCKFLGHIQALNGTPTAFCTGVATIGGLNLGGMAIVNLTNLAPIYEIPMPMMSNNSFPLTENPSDIDLVDGHLRFYFFPDQHCSDCTLFVVDALTDSPFEYGGGPTPQ